MHVPFTQHQQQLLFGELRVHQSQWHAVKRQVPRGVPGVFPLVGHRDHVGVIEVRPFVIASAPSFGGRRGVGRSGERRVGEEGGGWGGAGRWKRKERTREG